MKGLIDSISFELRFIHQYVFLHFDHLLLDYDDNAHAFLSSSSLNTHHKIPNSTKISIGSSAFSTGKN